MFSTSQSSEHFCAFLEILHEINDITFCFILQTGPKFKEELWKCNKLSFQIYLSYVIRLICISCSAITYHSFMLEKHILVFKSSNATVRVIILIFWLHKDLNSKRSWLIGMQTHFYVIHQVHLLCVSIDDEAFIFFYQFSSFLSIMQYIW